MKSYDVIIVGAGAAGLMCAIQAGKRGRSVCLIDHAQTVGEKIRISGGGRCNFTNTRTTPKNFLSENPRFCISALKGYTQQDFISLVESHGIAYHEKALGQLFCDGKSVEIIDMLKNECKAANVTIWLETTVDNIEKTATGFELETSSMPLTCESLVIATGGKSIPKMGATGFGYDVAGQFGLKIIEPRPALVPFTFNQDMLTELSQLSGISVDATVKCRKTEFREALLLTHRGVSGPSILQISSYWREGDEVEINLAPDIDVMEKLKTGRQEQPKQEIQTHVSYIVPKRLADYICDKTGTTGRIADLSNKKLEEVARAISAWRIKPGGTEGYRTAEVTLGGVDTKGLSSKTMETNEVPGLYFIGEVVDVTGHLGGYNFQWAWSSGYAAGQNV
ncbi:MAG: NAD(P)/FAD-dependent oxidoreductase [Methyloligellaceae bacterium]